MRFIRLACVLIVSLSFPLASSCLAKDVIKLKNGNSFAGQIVLEADDSIQVEIGAGMVMTFPKADIAEIVRGKAEPPPQSPQPGQASPAADTQQTAPTDEAFSRFFEQFSRLMLERQYDKAAGFCDADGKGPDLAASRGRVAALRQEVDRIRDLWTAVRKALPKMIGKEILFQDGVGANMLSMEGDMITLQGDHTRSVYELDPELGINVAGIADHASRAVFLFYNGKWKSAQQELLLAQAGGYKPDPCVSARLEAGLAEMAAEKQERAADFDKKREQRTAEAERIKAGNEVFKLTRSGRDAANERRFREALDAFQSARQIAEQYLPPFKAQEIDKAKQRVIENARILLEINVGPVTNPIYVEQITRDQDRSRGEWKRKKRRDQRDETDYQVRDQVAQAIAMALSATLQQFGYAPLNAEEAKGQRHSVMRVDYVEQPFSVLLNSSIPPMPGPIVTPVYGTKLEIMCHLQLFDADGNSIWEHEVRLSTPPTADWGVTIRQTALMMLQQKIQALSFGITPEEGERE